MTAGFGRTPIQPAEPDRAVAAAVGDGRLEMFLGELATLRDLGLIELKQRTSQLPNLAVDFGATDFPAVARALGGALLRPLHNHRRRDRRAGV